MNIKNIDRTHPRGVPGHPAADQSAKRASKLVGMLVVTLFALAACTTPGQTGVGTSSIGSQSEGAGSAEALLAPGNRNQLPLDFQIAVYQGQGLLGGQEVQFSELLGQDKPIVLNFWAGLCPPCRLEMPDFEEVYGEYQDRIFLVGVDVGVFVGLGSEAEGRALLEEVGATYPAGTTPDAEVMRAYQVIGMPTTIFITPDGKITQKWTGLLTKSKMEELVKELIEESGSS